MRFSLPRGFERGDRSQYRQLDATARITAGDCAKRAPASGNFRAAFMPFMREVRRTQNTRAPFPACFPRDARTRDMPQTLVKS